MSAEQITSDHMYSSTQNSSSSSTQNSSSAALNASNKKKKISLKQKEIMVSFMENHPEMRNKLLPSPITNKFWEQLMKELEENSDPLDDNNRYFNNIHELKKIFSRLKRTTIEKYLTKRKNKDLLSPVDQRIFNLIVVDESAAIENSLSESFNDLKRTAIARSSSLKLKSEAVTSLDRRILKLTSVVDGSDLDDASENTLSQKSPIKTYAKIRIKDGKVDDQKPIILKPAFVKVSDGDLKKSKVINLSENKVSNIQIGSVTSTPTQNITLHLDCDMECDNDEDGNNIIAKNKEESGNTSRPSVSSLAGNHNKPPTITQKLKQLKQKEVMSFEEYLKLRESTNIRRPTNNKMSLLKRRRMKRDYLRRQRRKNISDDNFDSDSEVETSLLRFMELMRYLERRKEENVRTMVSAVKDCCNQISNTFVNISRAADVVADYYTSLSKAKQ